MPRLVRVDTGLELGTITDAHVAFLVDQLEDDTGDDQSYFIDRETLELLADNGCDPELLAMLDKALATGDDMEIAWE